MKGTQGKPVQAPIPLLNCPFCGSVAILWQWFRPATPGYLDTYTHSVECAEACASTSDEVEAEWAIEKWNQRAAPAAIRSSTDAKTLSVVMQSQIDKCRISALTTRVCELGTKCCTVYHQ